MMQRTLSLLVASLAATTGCFAQSTWSYACGQLLYTQKNTAYSCVLPFSGFSVTATFTIACVANNSMINPPIITPAPSAPAPLQATGNGTCGGGGGVLGPDCPPTFTVANDRLNITSITINNKSVILVLNYFICITGSTQDSGRVAPARSKLA